MPKKKQIVVNAPESGTISQEAAKDIYKFIQGYYATHPRVYAACQKWKAEQAAAQK